MDKYRLIKEESLLLVIDIQERLVPVMDYKDQVIKNTEILAKAAKEMDIPIVVTEQYPKGLGKTVPELNEVLSDAQLFEKNVFTAYTEEVKEAIEKSGKKKIIITGMETHVCVFQTVRDLIEDGYQVFVAKDAVSSRTKMNYRNGLDLMYQVGATISNTETIAFDLLKISGTPEFKIISKLIK